MNSLFAELGLMDAPEKDTLPSHEMLCLGIWINTLDMTLSVPAFCVEELQLELNMWLNKQSFTKRELQQLLGKLSYVSACVRPGRAFMSRLLNALRSCSSSPKRTIHPISNDLRADINWWLYFLSHYNLMVFLWFPLTSLFPIRNFLLLTLVSPVAGRFASVNVFIESLRTSF